MIVTGGSSGIGASIIDELLEQGVVVANFDLQPGKVVHENLYYFQTDISDRQQVEENVTKVIEEFGQIDGLVNNAGINVPRLLVDEENPHGQFELSDEVFDKMMAINQKGLYLMTQAVARTMMPRHEGVIINMSSECGLEGSEGQSPYAATKAAVNSFTRSWSKELGKQGIRVVGIAPGIMEETGLRTEAYETALAYTRGLRLKSFVKTMIKQRQSPWGAAGSSVKSLI